MIRKRSLQGEIRARNLSQDHDFFSLKAIISFFSLFRNSYFSYYFHRCLPLRWSMGVKQAGRREERKREKKKKNHGMYKNSTWKYPTFLILDFLKIDYKINVIWSTLHAQGSQQINNLYKPLWASKVKLTKGKWCIYITYFRSHKMSVTSWRRKSERKLEL